ncbi:MAG: hypothetical protein KDD82_18730 [Planctomycetes bacterium]|nr:hypothetical protein [Planctomycetota bacterium]
MSRSILTKLLFSFVAVAATSLPLQAQETPTTPPSSAAVANIEAAIADMQAAKNRAVVAGDQAEVERLNGIITRLRANLDQQKNQEAFDRTKQNLRDNMEEASSKGLTGQVNEIAKSIENVNNLEQSANEHRTAAANADSRDARNTAGTSTTPPATTNNQPARNNDPYGYNRSRVGEKVVEGLFGVGTALLQSWLNGSQSPDERAAMDRIFANNDAAVAGADPSNPGTPIYGPNGEIIGYDRTGDNKVDSKDTDGNGTPDTFAGGSYDDDYTNYSDPSEFAYDDYTNNDTSDAFKPATLGNVGGGGASAGDTGGASLGGDTGGDDDADADEDEDKDEDADKDEDKDEDEADDADLADADDSKSRSSSSKDGDGIDAEVKDFVGRIFILPKDAITAAVATGGVDAVGNQAPGAGDGFADDGWNDSDNGDWADEEDDWGWEENEWGSDKPAADPTAPAAEPGVPAMGAPLTPEEELLKQEIIKVEAEIAKWNKAERDKKLQLEDPYAFETTRGLQGEAEDPFKAYRNEDGKLDLTKVNVWIIVDDTWKEPVTADPAGGTTVPAETGAPQEFAPTRMRLIVPDELLDRFEPIQGGWVSLRGTPVEAEFNPAVFPGLKGSVQDLDLVQVLAVTKEEPADLENTEYSDY